MALPTFFASAVESWAAFYDAHKLVSVAVRYLHLAGLLVGGGTALATDRHVLRAARSGPSERATSLAALDASHRIVVPALALVAFTGLLMTASDLPTFLGSRIYWSKMGLVTLLLLNGVGLLVAERAVSRGRVRGWLWLGVVSGASLCLWLVILLMGVWLTAAA
jgi:uncharacterized membrane protein